MWWAFICKRFDQSGTSTCIQPRPFGAYLSLECEAPAVESVEIRVGHLVVEAVVVGRVECRAGAVVRPGWPRPREITAERHVGGFGVQVGQRARAKVANGRRGGGPARQEVHRPHGLRVVDTMTQAADRVGGASVVLGAGGVAAWRVGHFQERWRCVQGHSAVCSTLRCVKLTFVPWRTWSGHQFGGGAFCVADWRSGRVLVQDLLRNKVFESDARRRHLMPSTGTQRRRQTLWELRLWAGCRPSSLLGCVHTERHQFSPRDRFTFKVNVKTNRKSWQSGQRLAKNRPASATHQANAAHLG